MNFNVTIDWKFALAIGGAISGIILSTKVNPEDAEKVLTNFVNTIPDLTIAN